MSYIIYGYDTLLLNTNTLYTSSTGSIILIEPRKVLIDKFRHYISTQSHITQNIKLITKALSDKNKMSESILAYDSDESTYYIDTEYHPDIKRERIYTTSLINIINDYDIQNIECLYFNINVSNINNILTSIKPLNHIFSKISFKSCVNREIYETHDIFNVFNRQALVSKPPLDNWVEYAHKNLTCELPKICMFFTKQAITTNNKLAEFIKKYRIDTVINKQIYPFDSKLPQIQIDNSILFHKYMLNNLDTIFKSDKQYDIIIAFNENILQSQPNFFILYPPKDDTLHINREFDIIYSSKNCMYMLYQILHSNYFNEWIHQQAQKKPSLLKFFIRRWFYEYIAKTFKIAKT